VLPSSLPALPADRDALLSRIREDLAQLNRLRTELRGRPHRAADRNALRTWQAQRLARTYQDLLDSPRYHAAARFFLSDLYGNSDLCERDAEVARILPTLASMLPIGAVQSLALAIALDALSEHLDARLIEVLRECQPDGPLQIDTQRYATAYRACTNREQRQMQIDIVDAVGRLLDSVAHRPLVGTAIALMREPARLAGLSVLQDFLERGLKAFCQMQGAEVFLQTVRRREEGIMERLMGNVADPFAITTERTQSSGFTPGS